MELEFSIGKGIAMDFSIGGKAPAPPTPSDAFPSVTSNVFRVEGNALIGEVTSDFTFTPDA